MTENELHDRPVGELFGHLYARIQDLVREELKTAREEARSKLRLTILFAIALSTAAAGAVVALGAGTAFVILLLSLAMTPWLAALIVAVAAAIGAAILALLVRNQIPALIPKETIEGISETAAAARREVGETVDALKYKTDVKSRLGERLAETVHDAREILGSTFEHTKQGVSDTVETIKEKVAEQIPKR